MRRAAIYVRVSGPDDPRTFSLDTQEEGARAKLHSKGFADKDIDVYTERYTGMLLWERPELNKLRENVRAKRYAAIAVYCLDRLARKGTHNAILFDEAERHDCEILSATEEIDNTPEGQLIRSIRGYLGEAEHAKILDRTNRGRAKLREAGKPVANGKAAYGYAYDPKTKLRVKVPAEEAIVKEIYRLYLDGLSSQRVADRLNDLGVKCPSDTEGRKRNYRRESLKIWHAHAVLRILKDSSYTGMPMMLGRSKTKPERSAKGRQVVERLPRDEWEAGTDPTPVIIPADTWDQVQRQLTTRRTYAETLTKKRQILLRGHIKCGVCGKAMTHTTRTFRYKNGTTQIYPIYYCTSGVAGKKNRCSNVGTPLDWVDQVVWDHFLDLIKDKSKFEARLKEAIHQAKDTNLERDRATHLATIEATKTKLKRLIVLCADDDDPTVRETFLEKRDALKKIIVAHESEVAEIDSRLSAISHQETALNRWQEMVAKVAKGVEEATLDEKRVLFHAFGLTVHCRKRQVTLRFGLKVSDCVSSQRSEA